MKDKTKVKIKKLLAFLEEERKTALNDCWKYHKDIIKEEGDGLLKSDLEDFLYDLNGNDWEDIHFFAGYIRGLDFAKELLNESLLN